MFLNVYGSARTSYIKAKKPSAMSGSFSNIFSRQLYVEANEPPLD